MNRFRLRAMFRPGEEIDHLSPLELKRHVEAIIAATLDGVANAAREPDRWEALHLSTAISYLMAGLYRPALLVAWWGLVSPDERPSQQNLRIPEDLVDVSLAKLREALTLAQRQSPGPFSTNAPQRVRRLTVPKVT